MKLKFNLLTIVLAFAAMANVHSQTLDEVIAKNVDAMGGKDKIKSITSISIENTMEAMGNESSSTTVIVNGVGAKTKTDFNGQAMVQCYTAKGGWAINPMGGSSEATPMPEDQYKAGKSQIYIEEPYMDYAAKGNKVELVDKEKLQNADVYKIKVTTPENRTTFYYIDANTYLVVQTSTSADMMGQTTEVVSKFSNYEKTDVGYVIPKTTTVSYGDQFSLTMKVKKVEINKQIDPSVFDLGNMK